MARQSLIEREDKRKKLSQKYASKRKEIKKALAHAYAKADTKSITELQSALQKLPRNSAPIRRRNRCAITGRPRGYQRLFGLCRIKIREMMGEGLIPGLVKSSW